MRRGGSGVSKRALSVLKVGMLKMGRIEIASVVNVREEHHEDM